MEAIKTKRFWLIFLILFNGIFFGIYWASVYKLFNSSVLEDKVLTLGGALGMVFNGCSRVIWASLQDKFGFKRVYRVMMILQTTVAWTVFLIHENPTLYVIWICLVFTVEGGHFSMFPALCGKVFGIQFGAQIMTCAFFAITLAIWAGFILNSFDGISYHTMFWISGGLSLLNFMLLFLLDDSQMLSQKSEQMLEEGKTVLVDG